MSRAILELFRAEEASAMLGLLQSLETEVRLRTADPG
jgi:hypothetical protein